LAYELVQADQKFLAVDEFLVEARIRTNSLAETEKLKVFSFQTLVKMLLIF